MGGERPARWALWRCRRLSTSSSWWPRLLPSAWMATPDAGLGLLRMSGGSASPELDLAGEGPSRIAFGPRYGTLLALLSPTG